jgi:hypothetical protein
MTLEELIQQNKNLNAEIAVKKREIVKCEATQRELRLKAKELILPNVKYPIGTMFAYKYRSSTQAKIVDLFVHLYDKPHISYRIAPILKDGNLGNQVAYGISEEDIAILVK